MVESYDRLYLLWTFVQMPPQLVFSSKRWLKYLYMLLSSLQQLTFQVIIKAYAEDIVMGIIDYLNCLPDVCKWIWLRLECVAERKDKIQVDT